MADDDATPDETVRDDLLPAEEAPLVDRGECPLCGTEFEDPEVFRDHLGEVHDLHDEEGATTVLWTPAFAVVPVAIAEPEIPDAPTPPRPAAAPEKAPVGLIVLVALLVLFGGGLVVYIQSDDGANSAADAPLVSTDRSPDSTVAPSDTGGATEIAAAPDSTSSPTGSAAPSIDVAQTGPTTTDPLGATVPVTDPPPPSSTTTVTTAPPANFVAPTTATAAVDSCSRSRGQWVVTYSWRYVGGTGWAPLATYTAVGGGRYRNTVTVPARTTPIATVGVVDTNGKRYDVALSPSLSAASC